MKHTKKPRIEGDKLIIGGWARTDVDCTKTMDGMDFNITLINVYPLFGREHELLPSCWCKPTIAMGKIVEHNIFH